MKYIFIPMLTDDPLLEMIESCLNAENRVFFFPNVDKTPQNYALYPIDSTSAYILKPRTRNCNADILDANKIEQLYQELGKKFGRDEHFVIAIHWGAVDTEELAQQLCNERLNALQSDIKEKVILTYYSGKYGHNKTTFDQIKNYDNVTNKIDKVIEMINGQIDLEKEVDKIEQLYDLKENLVRNLWSLTVGIGLTNNQKKKIKAAVGKKSTEIGDKLLSPISDKISVLFKSLEGQQSPESKKCNKALQDIRANINTLIDVQLKKANKKAIYER